ncbi:MAG: ribulokinase [Henriciella sp.]|nr:ribulokinase [Henriciella sp.]
MTIEPTYALGMDLGSQSARVAIICCETGELVGTAVSAYASGEAGVLLDPSDPDLARQRPDDYLDAIIEATAAALVEARERKSGFSADQVIGIGTATTGSTPIPVDAACVPLARQERFKDTLAAQAWMWKDHTAYQEAADIVDAIQTAGAPYLNQSGGAYSSEWYWAKLLKCARTAPEVSNAAASWMELQDFVPAVLSSAPLPQLAKRGVCAAEHKGMYSPAWGGWPDADFLGALHPDLARILDSLPSDTATADQPAGTLSHEWAEKLGLPVGIPVAVGCLDAHAGALGAGAGIGTLVKVVGTSTCDITVVEGPAEAFDAIGLSGAANGSVIPGVTGLEAGQSAVGDLFEWGARLLAGEGPLTPDVFQRLTDEAAALGPGESGLLALDWNNGNRSVLMDSRLSGLILGQSLQTRPGDLFRALIEATAFGARIIVETMVSRGVVVDQIVAAGGVFERNRLAAQIYADILGCPILFSGVAEGGASGAALFGAVVGGAYPDVETARAAMCAPPKPGAAPNPDAVAVYDKLYALYRELHDSFGAQDTRGADLGSLMKRLLDLRDQVRREKPTNDT